MASTYSDRLKLELMETGANSGAWGTNTNNNLQVLDAFAGGYLSKSVAGSSDVTLTTADADPAAESSNKVIELTGALTGNINVFLPAVENNYIIYNNTSGSFTLTVAATGHTANGVAVTQGTYASLYCDGSANFNVENSLAALGPTAFTGSINVSVDANVSGNANVTGNVTVTGNISAAAGTFTANVDLGDSDFLRLGTGNDLQISHDGTNSLIDNNTGELNIQGDGITLRSDTGTETYITMDVDDGVDLYFNNSKKFETTTSGVDVTGEVLADKAYIAEATLTDGATINWDMSTESVAKVTLGGNRTLAAPTNGSTGQFCSLNVIQDSTGSRTLTWNAAFEFKDDTAPTLTTTGSKGDLFVFRYNGSKWLEVGRNLNISQS